MPRTNSGRQILTARHSTLVIPDNLLLAAAATFARQRPRAGPPADVLAAPAHPAVFSGRRGAGPRQ